MSNNCSYTCRYMSKYLAVRLVRRAAMPARQVQLRAAGFWWCMQQLQQQLRAAGLVVRIRALVLCCGARRGRGAALLAAHRKETSDKNN